MFAAAISIPRFLGWTALPFIKAIWMASCRSQIRSFDYVTCLEGRSIETRDDARVRAPLKPGGHLIVSVPNILNIEERLKWLLYGYAALQTNLACGLRTVQSEYDGRASKSGRT